MKRKQDCPEFELSSAIEVVFKRRGKYLKLIISLICFSYLFEDKCDKTDVCRCVYVCEHICTCVRLNSHCYQFTEALIVVPHRGVMVCKAVHFSQSALYFYLCTQLNCNRQQKPAYVEAILDFVYMLGFLTDFNGMSTDQGLFYGNDIMIRELHSLYVYIYIF